MRAGTQNLRGIFKSTDGGITWTEKVNGIVEYDRDHVLGFTVDPRTSDVVYAAAELGSWASAGTEMPGRDSTAPAASSTRPWTEATRGSRCGGATTSPALRLDRPDPPGRGVRLDGDLRPENPRVLLAAAGSNVYHDGTGVYLSTDGAATWQPVLVDPDEEAEGFHSVEFDSPNLSIADAASSRAGLPQREYAAAPGRRLPGRVTEEATCRCGAVSPSTSR